VRLRAVVSETCPEHMPELDLALNTGLRLGELFGLVWENVNRARRVLPVPRTKNGETRHVPLNGPALAALAELRKRDDETGPVIRNADGGALTGPLGLSPPLEMQRFGNSLGIASATPLPAA